MVIGDKPILTPPRGPARGPICSHGLSPLAILDLEARLAYPVVLPRGSSSVG